MKKFNKKSLVLLVCAALLLTFTVSGTVAYLVDASGPVENQFKPATVDITTTDKIENGAKKDAIISNNSTIPVYIRVAVIANWYNQAGEIVAPWNDYEHLPIASGWVRSGGYYYYTSAVSPTTTSVPFFNENDAYKPSQDITVPDAHLEMTIIAQAVQADGTTADGKKVVVATWGVDPTTLKTNN